METVEFAWLMASSGPLSAAEHIQVHEAIGAYWSCIAYCRQLCLQRGEALHYCSFARQKRKEEFARMKPSISLRGSLCQVAVLAVLASVPLSAQMLNGARGHLPRSALSEMV